jgi:hypothetical protein
MTAPNQLQPGEPPKRRYAWPWFVLAAVLLGIILSILWLSREIARTRRLKELNAPADTNRPTALPHK